MICLLGNITFELLQAPTSQQSTASYEYADHAVVLGKTRLQFVGDQPETIELGMRFHKGFCDPQGQLDALKAQAAKHAAIALVLGDGTVKGYYVITQIGATTIQTNYQGVVAALEVSLSLREAVIESQAVVSRAAAKAKAKAIRPVSSRPLARRRVVLPAPLPSKESVPLTTVVRWGGGDG